MTIKLWILAAGLAVVVPGPTPVRNSVSLTWDYDTNNVPDVFKLYTSTNLALPTTNWTLVGSVSGAIQNISITNINQQQQWFFVTASNWWGESDPSNIAGIPQPPSVVGNLQISK